MDHVQETIKLALVKLHEQETQVTETKKLINSLCKWAGNPLMFPDADSPPVGSLAGFRSDQFYGQPLTGVVRDILKARKAANLGSASVNEIYDTMTAGGYKFDTANVENAKRVLRISLTKNSAVFHKLPNGEYGLREWYPNIKEGKPKATTNGAADADAGGAPDGGEFDFAAKEEAADIPAESA
jgi:hypothetical protein